MRRSTLAKLSAHSAKMGNVHQPTQGAEATRAMPTDVEPTRRITRTRSLASTTRLRSSSVGHSQEAPCMWTSSTAARGCLRIEQPLKRMRNADDRLRQAAGVFHMVGIFDGLHGVYGARPDRLRASMSAEPAPTVSDILATRGGEEMALNDRHLNPQMGRILRTLGFDRVWTGGEGAHLIDAHGERYLDLVGGYGVFAIGRNHPDAIAAVEQVLAARTGNLPQLGVTLLSGVLAEQLLARAPASVAAMVPANTGTEAVEAAVKIARAATGRPRVLYAEHAFHGLTLGSLSLNGNAEFRDGFGPLLPGCDAVGFGDLEALRGELAREDVAAFVVEPVQGKGVNIPADDYLPGAQRLCREAGALFVCDEVQTGIGRTGRFLALEHWSLEPDMVCVSKALSGGLVPIGAVLVSRSAFRAGVGGV